MEIEVSAEAKDKRLNRAVAITVVTLSVIMALGNIKDGNIVQNMQQAKSDSVDAWSEYQATRTKARVVDATRAQIAILKSLPTTAAAAGTALASANAEAAKYAREAPRLKAEAQALSERYDAYNVHDDQFDASEALLTTAISIAAVAALVESGWMLAGAWIFALAGIAMSVCGFAGLAFHPAILSGLLG